MMKTENNELIIPASAISGYRNDDYLEASGFSPVYIFFPLPLAEEMECIKGLTGIWYSFFEYDIEFSLRGDEECSFIDTAGNFYCSTENTELDEVEREWLRRFVVCFKTEIEDLKNGSLPFLEFTYILNACRERSMGGDLSLVTEEIHDAVYSMWRQSLLTKAQSGLPVNIVLDSLGGYRMNDFTTDGAKRIWFQNNEDDDYENGNGFYRELDETLATSYIRPSFYKYEVKIKRKERSEIRAFIENNRILLSCLSDVLDTGVDISLFRENFIKRPLLRPKKERRALEGKVRARVMEYRASKHFTEYYRYSETYYRQAKQDFSRLYQVTPCVL